MQYTQQAAAVTAEVNKAVQGKQQTVNTIWMAMLAGGHVLIEDIPGVGKTTLALAFARALDLKESRVQFTPDVLPSDLVGFSVYQKETGKFVYHAGAVMCNLFWPMKSTVPAPAPVRLAGSHGGKRRHGGRRDARSAAAVYRFCNGKPRRLGGYADAAGIPA